MDNRIEHLVGQNVKVKARIGVKSRETGKVVLEHITINGDIKKDHAWITPNKSFINLISGDWITCTSTVIAYQGFDKQGNQVTKYGFNKNRNIRRIS